MKKPNDDKTPKERGGDIYEELADEERPTTDLSNTNAPDQTGGHSEPDKP